MKRTLFRLTAILLVGSTLLQSCRADLGKILDKDNPVSKENTKKGKELLGQAWKTQGLDSLSKHQVYSYDSHDEWKGMLGSIGKIWPDKKGDMSFKYKIGTFDGQVTFKGGKRDGEVAGLQNWNYYEIGEEQDTVFQKRDKRLVFGISAFQYFGEMVDRLKNAPIIVYAGEDEARGEMYDLVVCTWKTIEAHDESDQYVVWINKKTNMVDYVQYTIRENYLKMPGYKMIRGGIEFGNYKTVDGVQIPHEQTVFVFDIKKKKKNYLHQLTITNFKFDSFDPNDLVIDEAKGVGGDFK